MPVRLASRKGGVAHEEVPLARCQVRFVLFVGSLGISGNILFTDNSGDGTFWNMAGKYSALVAACLIFTLVLREAFTANQT